jgi:hypothetical protein
MPKKYDEMVIYPVFVVAHVFHVLRHVELPTVHTSFASSSTILIEQA